MEVQLPITNKADEAFWEALISVGKEVLSAGQQMGFGMSLVEIKFQEGSPAILIRSIAMTTKYPDNNSAKIALAQELEKAEAEQLDGVRTYSVVYNKGQINRILLDEYENRLLK